MQQIRRFGKTLLLAAAMIFSVIGTGCAARVRYYDTGYHDYHRWDPSEARAYQEYWYERGKQYREWTDTMNTSSESIGNGATLIPGATKTR